MRFFPTNGERNREKKWTEPIFEFRHVASWGIGQSLKLSVSRKLLDGFRWNSSCVVTFRYSFSWEYQKRENEIWKNRFFLKIMHMCTCKVEKSRKIFTPDFEVFYNWRWKNIENWLLPLIFSEFHRAVFEKPIIFDFVRFLSRPRDEIEKSGSPIFFSIPFSVGWKKPFGDIWNG